MTIVLLRLTRSKRLSGRIFTSLKDKGAVAQVDETRARAFLQQGLTAEAEKAADSSVRTLEKELPKYSFFCQCRKQTAEPFRTFSTFNPDDEVLSLR